MLKILHSLITVAFHGSKKYVLRTDLFIPKALPFSTCQYILLFATVIKCIAHLNFNLQTFKTVFKRYQSFSHL